MTWSSPCGARLVCIGIRHLFPPVRGEVTILVVGPSVTSGAALVAPDGKGTRVVVCSANLARLPDPVKVRAPQELDVPSPDYLLRVGSATHAVQTFNLVVIHAGDSGGARAGVT